VRLAKLTDRGALPGTEELLCGVHRVGVEAVPIDDGHLVATTAQDQGGCAAGQTRTQQHDPHDSIMPLRAARSVRLPGRAEVGESGGDPGDPGLREFHYLLADRA
jgi:hypothetical protein